MIASLHGVLLVKAPDALIVDVNGVGYKVLSSLQTQSRLPPVGEKVFLFVHTSVREDDISLFGFVDESEKKIFQRLITVNGIGPRLALTILSGILPEDLALALHREDIASLTAISGIGKKTAERMILDLKGKLAEFLTSSSNKDKTGSLPLSSSKDGKKVRLFEDAVSALVNLGYTRPAAERVLSQVSIEEDMALESIIRQSLRMLSERTTT